MSETVETLRVLPWSERVTPAYGEKLNALARASLVAGGAGKTAREELRKWMGLDATNFAYFLTRWRAFHGSQPQGVLTLHGGSEVPAGDIAYSTATLPPALQSHLPWVDYASLKTPPNLSAGQGASLWVKKMMAGTGSSLDRRQYLADRGGQSLERVELGAKGTDLFVPLADGSQACLAEIQWLRSILGAKRGDFARVYLHDIVGSETESAIRSLWEKPALLQPDLSYSEWVESLENVFQTSKSFQAHLPTVDAQGQLTYQRHAPGGHGLFGLEELWLSARGRVPSPGPVSVVGNGEDLSSQPDPAMVGWMIRESIPIAMVTTTKSPVDRKGGQIAVVVPSQGVPYVTIVEVAQAEAAGQGELFGELGLRDGDGPAFFNTNMALFNHGVLGPKLKSLWEELGEDQFLQALSPDLIQNPKKQIDPDGESRTYIQLEGAMGSVLLNLDRVWRSRRGEPLVHFINVGAAHRSEFFSPIKTPFDFFLQFFSDRFRFDQTTMAILDQRPGKGIHVSLQGSPGHPKHYAELHHVLSGFEGTRVLQLDHLSVRGCVRLAGVELRGTVKIEVDGEDPQDIGVMVTGQVPVHEGRPVLENVLVKWGGTLQLVPLRNCP